MELCWICIPLCEEVDCGCLARCLPLLCEVVIVLVVHCLCERLYLVGLVGVGTPVLCRPLVISSVEIVEILLGEGGDVELGARTSKQILLFAFDPLTLTLSLFTLCIAIHCHIIYMLVCLCASLVLNHESFI